jgi:hypothetical protein
MSEIVLVLSRARLTKQDARLLLKCVKGAVSGAKFISLAKRHGLTLEEVEV